MLVTSSWLLLSFHKAVGHCLLRTAYRYMIKSRSEACLCRKRDRYLSLGSYLAGLGVGHHTRSACKQLSVQILQRGSKEITPHLRFWAISIHTKCVVNTAPKGYIGSENLDYIKACTGERITFCESGKVSASKSGETTSRWDYISKPTDYTL